MDGDESTVVVATQSSIPPANNRAGAPRTRYKLRSQLGRGGMGEVLSARDEQLGRSVAIKRLHDEAPAAEAIARFVREAQIQGRLDHPAIVPVHEIALDDQDQPFFVMKQLSTTTVADVVGRLGDPKAANRYSRQRLLRAFADVCLAIEFAHTRGVVHRDLKPANIVLGEFGEVYVLDWGIAHLMAKASDFADIPVEPPSTIVHGTPGYMSPEQLRGVADLDGRSDIYALGCILFELLAAEPLHPRGAAAVASTLAGIDRRPSVRAPDRDIPPELDAICVQATRTDRADRYATARELGDVVQRFLDGDRDLALRKQLAHSELDLARAAIARGNGVAARSEAIRAAGRALALDPTNREPADLVARLMIAPPDETPPEVDRALDKIDDDALFKSRRLIAAVMGAYLSFFPILYWAGFHVAWFLVGGGATCIGTAILVMTLPRSRFRLLAYIGLVGNVVMVAMFARLVGPFLCAPGLAVIFAMTSATHPRLAPPWAIFGIVVSSVLVPWLLELAGLVRQSSVVVGDALVSHTAAGTLDGPVAMIGLVLYVLLLIGMAVILARSQTNERRATQKMIQIQSWQLGQLVART